MWANLDANDRQTFKIVDCSPKAKQRIDVTLVGTGSTEPMHNLAKYPLSLLKIGQSFVVPFSANCNRRTLEASKRFNEFRTGKKFTVITHGDLELFEVARIF